MKSSKSEVEIQNEILDWLNQEGIFAFRVNTLGVFDAQQGIYRKPGKFFMKGCADILGILFDGKMLAVEVKSETGKASKEQTVFIDKINRMKGVGLIARSVDDVKRRLQDAGYYPRDMSKMQ